MTTCCRCCAPVFVEARRNEAEPDVTALSPDGSLYRGRLPLRKRIATLLAGCLLLAGVVCVPPLSANNTAIQELLREAEFDGVSISPGGEYLAVRIPMEDRTVLGIVRRSDGAWLTRLDPGARNVIGNWFWVSDTRVFASWGVRLRSIAQPVSTRMLYGIDVDGRNRRSFRGAVIDPLIDQPDQVLVLECVKVIRDECTTRLKQVSTSGSGRSRDIVDGPVPDATFMTDRTGEPRLSWADDDQGNQRVFLRSNDAWLPVNNEIESGVTVTPLGVNRAMTHGYLLAERREGPDVVESIDLRNGQREVVSFDPVEDPVGFVWSFDGHDLLGVRYGTGVPETRFIEPGHPHVALIRELEKEFPGEIVRSTSVTRDGRLVVVHVSSDRDPGRYYLLETTTGGLSPLMNERPWIKAEAMAQVRPVSIEARDGQALDGYLTMPRDPGGDAPLVVLVHGGPFQVRDAWRFDEEVQMLAAHGFAVMQVNFRGSAGKGLAFVESGYRQWGRAMQDDVTDATRWAMAQPGIDGRRVCIWGASYGGYAAVMATVREPSLYRCAIGTSGVYDLPLMYDWGDTQRTRWGRAWLEKSIGADMALLREHSPATHAGAIQANLLLVHGSRDHRVSPEQLKSMRRALDAASTPYEVLVAKGETHGFYNEDNRREYYDTVFDFLGRHLHATQ
jgi:dipeptidyl aminopeptidase/acylaminoacyl peptidase